MAGDIKNARLPDPYIVDYVHVYDRQGTFVLSCQENNDLYTVLKNNEIPYTRCDTPEAAVDAASEGAAVLILADGYPQQPTAIGDAVFEKAAKKASPDVRRVSCHGERASDRGPAALPNRPVRRAARSNGGGFGFLCSRFRR